MAGFVSDQILDQIRAANDVVEVIGSYFPLKRAGANFRALCPFHKEKTPSFHVHPQKQIWHCFGCGAGGDVFTFVMRYENLDFMAAVRRLSERAGIRIETENERKGAPRNQKDQLFQLHEEVTRLFHQNLLNDPSAEMARAYLAKRQVSADAIRTWRLGFATDRWDGLMLWARGRKYPESLLESAGLVVRGEKGVYDRFRGRLMIPIADEQGRVVAFSARILTDAKDQPKYVNSPETPIFQKGKLLFALYKARRAILDDNQVILCEGQLDAITCHEAGLNNVVAPQGTAFTEHHARILKRYADEVVMMFDADAAGQNAALRNAEPLWETGFALRVVVLPAGHDPDSFVKERGAEPLRELVRAAPRFFEFLLEHLSRELDARTERGKLQIAQRMADWLCKVQNPLLQAVHTQETARKLDVPEAAIRQVMKQLQQQRRSPPDAGDVESRRWQASGAPTDSSPLSTAEEILLQAMFADERLLEWVDQHLDRAWLRGGPSSYLIQRTLTLFREHHWNGISSLFNESMDETASRLVADISTRPSLHESMESAVADCLAALERGWVEQQLRLRRKELEQNSLSPTDTVGLQKEVFDLRRRLDQIASISTRNHNRQPQQP